MINRELQIDEKRGPLLIHGKTQIALLDRITQGRTNTIECGEANSLHISLTHRFVTPSLVTAVDEKSGGTTSRSAPEREVIELSVLVGGGFTVETIEGGQVKTLVAQKVCFWRPKAGGAWTTAVIDLWTDTDSEAGAGSRRRQLVNA